MARKPSIAAPEGHYGCTRCRAIKPVSDFARKANGKPASHCKACKLEEKRLLPPSDTIPQRFWAKVDKRGPDECWNWTGVKSSDGYGALYVGGKVFQEQAHRVSLRLHGIEPPQGGKQHTAMVCDHICRNRACVNPAHIRLVSQRVNTTENSESPHARNARKRTCKYGHSFDGWMLQWNGTRTRVCLTCWPANWRAVERFRAQYGDIPTTPSVSVTTEHGTALFPK